MNRLKSQAMPSPTCPVLLKRIVETLFPQQPSCEIPLEDRDDEIIPPVIIEELRKACAKVGNLKCPGLDGIPNIAMKAAIESKPSYSIADFVHLAACTPDACGRGCFPTNGGSRGWIFYLRGKSHRTNLHSIGHSACLTRRGKS